MTQLSMFDVQPAAKPLADICANRHGGNKKSEAANKRIDPFKGGLYDRVRIYVAGCAEHGCTLKEAARVLERPTGKDVDHPDGKYKPNELSGRFSELVRDKKLFDAGREREGAAVYVSDRRWVNGSFNEDSQTNRCRKAAGVREARAGSRGESAPSTELAGEGQSQASQDRPSATTSRTSE